MNLDAPPRDKLRTITQKLHIRLTILMMTCTQQQDRSQEAKMTNRDDVTNLTMMRITKDITKNSQVTHLD